MLDFVSELTRQVTREENIWSLSFYRSRGLLSFFLLFLLFVFMPLHSRVCISFSSSCFLLSPCSFCLFLCATFSVFQQRFFSSPLPSFFFLVPFGISALSILPLSYLFCCNAASTFFKRGEKWTVSCYPPSPPAEVNTTFGGFTTGPWFEPVHILTTCV